MSNVYCRREIPFSLRVRQAVNRSSINNYFVAMLFALQYCTPRTDEIDEKAEIDEIDVDEMNDIDDIEEVDEIQHPRLMI